MSSNPSLQKHPEGSTDYDCGIFEKLPDGSTVQLAYVSGMANVEKWLQELGGKSSK